MSKKEEEVRLQLEKEVVQQMKAANPDPPKEEPKPMPEPILEVKPVQEVKAAAPQPPAKVAAPVEEVK